MYDNSKFIAEFVAATKAADEDKMKSLAESVKDKSWQERIDLLQDLVTKLREEEANEEVTIGLEATLVRMKMANEVKDAETSEDSTVEEAKDEPSQSEENSANAEGSEAGEATQDVAADNSADKADEKEAEASTPVAESEGEAPAKEEKAEKPEQ